VVRSLQVLLELKIRYGYLLVSSVAKECRKIGFRTYRVKGVGNAVSEDLT
jgi:hypothetical protein